MELPGVGGMSFLRAAVNSRRISAGQDEIDQLAFVKLVRAKAKHLSISDEMLKRAVNVGFSGGEKKRYEILQMALFEPKLSVLDETDSGLDVDALKVVSEGVNLLRNPERSMLVITHYQRLLNHIVPDYVHILADGKILRSGGKELALEVEESGYAGIDDAANLEAVTGLTGVRAGAMQRWLKGWPDNRAEQWRFTRLSGVEKMDLRPATNAAATIGSKAISAMLPDQAVVLSFSNGVLDISGLSDLPPGVSASQLDGNEMELAKLAGSVPQSHPISDLSLAAMSSGVHLDITGKVEAPIIFAFTGDDNSSSAHPVVSVRLQDGASAVLAEWHQAAVGLSAPLTSIDIGVDSHLNYAKVQHDSANCAHLAATGIKLGKRSVFDGFQISVGGQLARLETHITLSDENSDCTLSAIYLGKANQHHDITTNMTHAKGHCFSKQIIRGVLDDSAREVFFRARSMWRPMLKRQTVSK